MDAVVSTASTVARESVSALQIGAGVLAEQANSLAQSAAAKDTLTWLTGDDEDFIDFPEEENLPPIVPMPLTLLQPWGAGWGVMGAHGGYHGACASTASANSVPFTVDHELNAKVVLWEGDACSLEVDALLAPSAANYAAGASTLFGKVLRYGGRDLRMDLKHVDACRSGEARIQKAYGLPCRWLLLTVGPKYKDKYHIAAQNTLNACYRECLQHLVEAELQTVAIPCVWYHKGYPPEEQAHVALRTIRRGLEKLRNKMETVVIVAADAAEAEMYDNLMHLYFPRTDQEAFSAAAVLPESCWSEWGEVSVEERKIRVSNELIQDDEERERSACLFSPTDDDDCSFLNAKDDADDSARRRLEGTMIEADSTDKAAHACLRYLRRAREMRPEPESSRFVFRAGQDRYARGVVVLLGARFPSLGVRDERTLPLFVKELELLQNERFVLMYMNSGVSSMDTANLEVLQEMLEVISAKYRNSLDQLLVLHPGLWFRAAFALGRAVSDNAALVWNNTVYLDSLQDLAAFISLEQLRLPEYIRHADLGG